jgi:hypothetical protein
MGASDPYQDEAIAGISAAIHAVKRFTDLTYAEAFEGAVRPPIGHVIKIGR